MDLSHPIAALGPANEDAIGPPAPVRGDRKPEGGDLVPVAEVQPVTGILPPAVIGELLA
jgi:hypothetical protein